MKSSNKVVVGIFVASCLVLFGIGLFLIGNSNQLFTRSFRVYADFSKITGIVKGGKVRVAGMDAGTYGSGWTVVDAYQIMMHLFTPEQRENYALEKLWRDAEDINLVKLLAEPKPAAKAVASKKKAKVSAKKVVAKRAAAVTKPRKPAAQKKKAK